jgi:nitric oxide reductase NorE protein
MAEDVYMTDVVGLARCAGGADRDAPNAAQRHVPGEPGIWVLLFGDMLVFTVLFTVYLQHRGARPELFADSQGALNRALGATNTLVLLTSSILVVFATRALRRPELRYLARPLTLAGVLVGACFVAIKAFEYHEKVAAGITPSTNEFFMYYFVLTGLHLAHVIIGLIVLTVLSTLARKPEPTKTHIAFFEGGACFWHMVDLLWIVIFPLIFLVR